jgi:hypothetical protein
LRLARFLAVLESAVPFGLTQYFNTCRTYSPLTTRSVATFGDWGVDSTWRPKALGRVNQALFSPCCISAPLGVRTMPKISELHVNGKRYPIFNLFPIR